VELEEVVEALRVGIDAVGSEDHGAGGDGAAVGGEGIGRGGTEAVIPPEWVALEEGGHVDNDAGPEFLAAGRGKAGLLFGPLGVELALAAVALKGDDAAGDGDEKEEYEDALSPAAAAARGGWGIVGVHGSGGLRG
jgi:hypothetical protein